MNKYKPDELVVIPKSVLEEFQKSTFGLTQLVVALKQAKPLQPIVEDAFDAGGSYTLGSHKEFKQTHLNKRQFIEKGVEF